MGNRLNRIVTRGGDRGETSLGDGSRVSKADPRIALIGEIDELNSWIGVARTHDPSNAVDETLACAQHDLFDLGGAVCVPGAPLLSVRHVERVDAASAALNETLEPLKEFVLPGGAPLVAWLHVARAVCRRVERVAADFFADTDDGAFVLAYLNRLSDFLFIAARFEAGRLGAPETLWRRDRSFSSAGKDDD